MEQYTRLYNATRGGSLAKDGVVNDSVINNCPFVCWLPPGSNGRWHRALLIGSRGHHFEVHAKRHGSSVASVR
jgi:hypothetical protein